MAFKIIWSPTALNGFDGIIHYLEKHWTPREIEQFILRLEEVFVIIQKNPFAFRSSSKIDVHEVLVTKHNLLIYQIDKNKRTIELLVFWDTRKNPRLKKI